MSSTSCATAKSCKIIGQEPEHNGSTFVGSTEQPVAVGPTEQPMVNFENDLMQKVNSIDG